MRILWLSMNKGLFHNPQVSSSSYNGGGWISSLQKLFVSCNGHSLALAFITHNLMKKEIQDNTTYYPIYEKPKSYRQKIKEYYGGYKRINSKKYVNQIEQIIQDFHPDIIHLFGLENPLATILGNTSVPIVVHLQGLLSPYDNAFFPVGFNKTSFYFPFSMREWVLRNGYIFAKNYIHIRGKNELSLFKNVEYVMGRTEWDYDLSQLLAPISKYFKINEVLREPFYDNAGKWEFIDSNELKVISTISNTVYKGLDTILKTAKILKTQTNFKFKWKIIGIAKEDPIVNFFEKNLGILSRNVNIEYLGVVDANQLCNELLKCHVYVHPSYIDNSPNSLCEAQLLGMPVIATFVGGIPSLIKNNETGVLIPANAPFKLTYIIKKIFLEKDFAKEIGKNAYIEALQRHDKTKILEDIINTYNVIIKNNIKKDFLE